ncbi:MAG: BPSS1780 family membrane protein, partial [Comamonas sp.]
AMWLSMALYIPLSLMFWHAPGLIHWHGIPPVKALFFSLVACMRNWRAYLVFCFAWMAFFMACGIVLALLTGILASLIGTVAGGIMVGAAMVLAAMFFTSIVFTFRDSFSAPDPTNPADAELLEE